MDFFDHPIVHKVMVTVISAGALTVGGLALSTRDDVQRHNVEIKEIQEIRTDIKIIGTNVQKIQEDVAVLKDRDKRDAGQR